MFETTVFGSQVEEAISSETQRGGLEHYETTIVRFLQSLATENEAALMKIEETKMLGQRRGIREALESVRSLARGAAIRARFESRTTLKLEDIQTEYKARFCQFWPLCK